MLFQSNCNKVIKQQSLKNGENHPEKIMESQQILYKDVLQSKELFYIVYYSVNCNPFHNWFLHDLSYFWCCVCAYALVFIMPRPG